MKFEALARNTARFIVVLLLMLVVGCGMGQVAKDPTCKDEGCAPGCKLSKVWMFGTSTMEFSVDVMPAGDGKSETDLYKSQCVKDGKTRGIGGINATGYTIYDGYTGPIECPSAAAFTIPAGTGGTKGTKGLMTVWKECSCD